CPSSSSSCVSARMVWVLSKDGVSPPLSCGPVPRRSTNGGMGARGAAAGDDVASGRGAAGVGCAGGDLRAVGGGVGFACAAFVPVVALGCAADGHIDWLGPRFVSAACGAGALAAPDDEAAARDVAAASGDGVAGIAAAAGVAFAAGVATADAA